MSYQYVTSMTVTDQLTDNFTLCNQSYSRSKTLFVSGAKFLDKTKLEITELGLVLVSTLKCNIYDVSDRNCHNATSIRWL